MYARIACTTDSIVLMSDNSTLLPCPPPPYPLQRSSTCVFCYISQQATTTTIVITAFAPRRDTLACSILLLGDAWPKIKKSCSTIFFPATDSGSRSILFFRFLPTDTNTPAPRQAEVRIFFRKRSASPIHEPECCSRQQCGEQESVVCRGNGGACRCVGVLIPATCCTMTRPLFDDQIWS